MITILSDDGIEEKSVRMLDLVEDIDGKWEKVATGVGGDELWGNESIIIQIELEDL